MVPKTPLPPSVEAMLLEPCRLYLVVTKPASSMANAYRGPWCYPATSHGSALAQFRDEVGMSPDEVARTIVKTRRHRDVYQN